MKDRTKNSIKPFWSWNDKLEKTELEKQIVQMKNNGIEGFFMHARGGLKTEYMSEEWFEMIEACLDKADELGMQAWAYDENGWPSGFADGLVPALGLEHQQKSLKFMVWEEENPLLQEKISEENVVAVFQRTGEGFALTENFQPGSYIFYYEVNPYYIDVFNKKTIAHFLNLVHDKYYERFKDRFGSSLKGFFTDEPQFCCSPWSFVFPETFQKRYGYDLLSVLPMFFFETEGYEAVRNDFQEMVSCLMRESFIRQMYDWCSEHHCKLTGHMMNENNLHSQMCSTNGVMPCYEYFHEPGMDHLKRTISTPLQPKQVSSVAAQLGRKTLTETFALCGWDVSLNELKWIAQWQYVNGVTSLCPHLEGYSLRGLRKRDYPASLFTQLPWFEEVYSEFADYFTTLGALLDSGKDVAPLLVIHPIHSAYILHDSLKSEKLLAYSERFDAFCEELNQEHILHHYGDETIMEHHGSIRVSEEGASLVVGKCEYGAVLLPDIINLTANTVRLLLEFMEKGGKVYAVERLPEFENGRKTAGLEKLRNGVVACRDLWELKQLCPEISPIEFETENPVIHLTWKELSDGRWLLYLVNNAKESQSVSLKVQGRYEVSLLDILKEREEKVPVKVEKDSTVVELDFAEYGSAVLVLSSVAEEDCGADFERLDVAETEQSTLDKAETERIVLDNMFHIDACDDNALTLDKCIYRVDDGEWQPEMAVINLQNKLFEMWKPCHVEMQFTFQIAESFDFDSVKLCMEDPEKFEIAVNGMPYHFQDCGMFVDHAIRQSKIGELLKMGENTIRLSCYFTQSEEIYFAKLTPGVHESVKNKLTYDTELESIYLTGHFGVRMEESYRLGERRCLHGGKTFSLIKPAEVVDITDITHQGFWFFTGKMALSQSVKVDVQKDKRYILSMKHLNAPAAQVYINGAFAGNMMFAPFELDVTELLKQGENKVTIMMLSGNRNLLGPHHKPEGESYSVGPSSFSDQIGWTDDKTLPPWTDHYNFVLFGCDLN